jgi:hypothetical protein
VQPTIHTDLPARKPIGICKFGLCGFYQQKRQLCGAGMATPQAAHFIESLEGALQDQRMLRSKIDVLKGHLKKLEEVKQSMEPVFEQYPDL